MTKVQSDPQLRQYVLDILADTRLQDIDFQLKPFPVVDWQLFQLVRKRILDCGISIIRGEFNPKGIDSPARYIGEVDALRIDFEPVVGTSTVGWLMRKDAIMKGTIVHEAVHAGFDVGQVKGSMHEEEVCGYLAMYLAQKLFFPGFDFDKSGCGDLAREALAHTRAVKERPQNSCSCRGGPSKTFQIDRRSRNFNRAKAQVLKDYQEEAAAKLKPEAYAKWEKDFGDGLLTRDGVGTSTICAN